MFEGPRGGVRHEQVQDVLGAGETGLGAGRT